MKFYLSLLFAIQTCFYSTVSIAQDSVEIAQILACPDDSIKLARLEKHVLVLIKQNATNTEALVNKMLDISRTLSSDYWQGQSWFHLAYIASQNGNDSVAINNFKTALPFLVNAADTLQMVRTQLNIAAISGRMGFVEEDLKNKLNAIKILECRSDYKNLLVHAYNGMGTLFFNQEDYSRALHYLYKAEKVAKEIGDMEFVVFTLYGISNALSSQHKFDEALVKAREALAVATEEKSSYSLCIAHTAFTELYSKWNKGGELLRHASILLKNAIKIKDIQYQIIGYMAMADGLGIEKKYAARIVYLKKAMDLVQTTQTVVQLDDIYKGLSESYEALGNYKAAFEAYKQYSLHKDLLINEKSQKNVTELEMKYQASNKEKEIIAKQLLLAKKEVEISKSRALFWLSIGILFLVLIASGYGLLHFKNKKKQQQRLIKSMEQVRELHMLQSLMQGEEKERNRIARELHDGVSGIIAAAKMHLSSFGKNPSATYEFNKAIDLMDNASVEIRKTAHNLMPEVLHHYGLSAAIQKFCESLSAPGSPDMQFHEIGNISKYQIHFELTIYRIVQELVYNAVKHAGASQIIIQLSQVEGLLSLTVEDDGIGLSRSNTEGIGMANIKNRVKQFKGAISWECGCTGGTSVYAEFEMDNYVLLLN